MPTFSCPYCAATRPTMQGLRSHIEQTSMCREKQYTFMSSYESDSESDQDQEPTSADKATSDVEMLVPLEQGAAGDLSLNSEDEEEQIYADPAPVENTPPAESAPEPPAPNAQKRRRPTVEEVEDEDDRYAEDFPEDAEAGAPMEACKTFFETLREQQRDAGRAPWYPFESEDQWELARWLMTSGLSQKKTDSYLKLKTVCEGINPSFHNNRAFLKHIDALPEGPQWFCHPFELKGDEVDADGQPKTEIVELWHRDPLECIQELLGNPSFMNQGYAPIRVYKTLRDGVLSNREYSEMWTADWWWKIQELLPPGGTLAPIIISSDKTQLTRFSGDKQAWPVYLTIGNIEKDTQRAPSSRATVLLGYIPVTKLEIFSKKTRSSVAHQLFHDCMRVMLEPLRKAGNDGVKMDCADGFVRMMYPILSAYIADYPEQCLVACCRENACPRCLVHPKERGKAMQKVFLGVLAKATDPAVQRAVRGIIDFIYYAHFKKHSDDSLAKLDAAWNAFHADKQIFLDKEIRKHFNINKIHKIKHYVDSIRSRGTADGFNTENTERLHIDLAKTSYNASNKVGYTRQMTVWLRRQEAVYKFGTYLQWAVPGYLADRDSSTAVDEDKDDPDEESESGSAAPEEPDDSDNEGELEDLPESSTSLPLYCVAKTPPFPNLTVTSICSDFQAPDFLRNLDRFLESKSITPRLEAAENSNFPVYKCLRVTLPHISEISSEETPDTIHAIRGEPMKLTAKGVKPAKRGQFDTILVQQNPPGTDQRPTDGISVARVRVIFRLPEDYGHYPDPLVLCITLATSVTQLLALSRSHALPARFIPSAFVGTLPHPHIAFVGTPPICTSPLSARCPTRTSPLSGLCPIRSLPLLAYDPTRLLSFLGMLPRPCFTFVGTLPRLLAAFVGMQPCLHLVFVGTQPCLHLAFVSTQPCLHLAFVDTQPHPPIAYAGVLPHPLVAFVGLARCLDQHTATPLLHLGLRSGPPSSAFVYPKYSQASYE
ncbi:hypothetical protein B0H17DRAFT_1215369 [Mycena rosella]|uniref:Uncharacterized protein n=1 Tax=Mycena rosella TaxID=1033263 RepID=A0AAD7G1L9_MYCRO|nr:hypothetical protein B0H17DRAFT_1215369 [Mycena rosella]